MDQEPRVDLPISSDNRPELLFRAEATQAQQDRYLGQAIVLRAISIEVVIALGLIAAIMIAAFLVFGEYTRRAKLLGVVSPSAGIVRVFARSEGTVASLAIAEGSHVQAGQNVCSIATDVATDLGNTRELVASALRQQEAELKGQIARQQQINRLDKENLSQKRDNALREIDQLKQQLKSTSQYSDFLRNATSKYSALAEKHVITEQEMLNRLDKSMQAQNDLESLRRQYIQIDQKLSDIDAELAAFDQRSASAQSDLQRQISAIERELAEGEALRQTNIISPQSGIVTGLLVKTGEVVAAGTPLFSILPDKTELDVNLFGNSSVIGFIRNSSEVELRFTAFPYEKFGLYMGRITDISRVTIPKKDLNVIDSNISSFAGQNGDNLYRITVRPNQNYVVAYGQHEPLKPGMTVEADVLLDTRHIYEWLFEPLLSLRGIAKGGDK